VGLLGAMLVSTAPVGPLQDVVVVAVAAGRRDDGAAQQPQQPVTGIIAVSAFVPASCARSRATATVRKT